MARPNTPTVDELLSTAQNATARTNAVDEALAAMDAPTRAKLQAAILERRGPNHWAYNAEKLPEVFAALGFTGIGRSAINRYRADHRG